MLAPFAVYNYLVTNKSKKCQCQLLPSFVAVGYSYAPPHLTAEPQCIVVCRMFIPHKVSLRNNSGDMFIAVGLGKF